MAYRVAVQVFADGDPAITQNDANTIYADSDAEAKRTFAEMILEANRETGYSHNGKRFRAVLSDDDGRKVAEYMDTVP